MKGARRLGEKLDKLVTIADEQRYAVRDQRHADAAIMKRADDASRTYMQLMGELLAQSQRTVARLDDIARLISLDIQERRRIADIITAQQAKRSPKAKRAK